MQRTAWITFTFNGKWSVRFNTKRGRAQKPSFWKALLLLCRTAGQNGICNRGGKWQDLGADYGDVTGKVNVLFELSEGDVPGSTNGFGNSQVKGEGRTNTSTFVTEVAVKLSDLGLVLSDFTTSPSTTPLRV